MGKYGDYYSQQCRERKEPELEEEECAAIGHEFGDGSRCLFCGYDRPVSPQSSPLEGK